MPRDILPTLGIPTIYISQPYGGMAPAQMEGFLTHYFEYQSLYLTGLFALVKSRSPRYSASPDPNDPDSAQFETTAKTNS